MTEKEIKENIKQLTVQIETPYEKGTGVLISYKNRPYILTVHHCIYGKGAKEHQVDADDVKFIFYNKAELYAVDIISLGNLVLLEIDKKDLSMHNFITLNFSNVEYERDYFIRGFPSGLDKAHNFKAKCNDDAVDKKTFKIEMSNITNDTSGNDAIDYMKGVSGSGVFYAKKGKLYLVGLVNALANQSGTFNAVHCTNLKELKVIPTKSNSSKYYLLAFPFVVLGLFFLLGKSSKEVITPLVKPIIKTQKNTTFKEILLSANNQDIYDKVSRQLTQSGFILSSKESLTNGYKIEIYNKIRQKSSVVYDNTIVKTNCHLSFTIFDTVTKNKIQSDSIDGIASGFSKEESTEECLKNGAKELGIKIVRSLKHKY